jgi:hypothetical protein
MKPAYPIVLTAQDHALLGEVVKLWGNRGKMRLRWHEAQAQTVLGQDPPVFVPQPITGEKRPQRGHGSPAPTPSSARRFSATSAEGTPVASSAAL